jgi:hypothetical protein
MIAATGTGIRIFIRAARNTTIEASTIAYNGTIGRRNRYI